MAIDNTGISSLDTGASDITYTGNEGPRSPQQEQQMQMQQQQQMQMAFLMQEYKDYVMQQEEAGRPAMPFEEWVRSIQSPMAEGGIARLGYIHGGITHPDGRRGFPGGSGRPGDKPIGTTSTGSLSSGANYGDSSYDKGNVQRQKAKTAVAKGLARDRKDVKEKLKSEIRKVTPSVWEKKDYKKLGRLKQYQINRNKVLAMRKMGILSSLISVRYCCWRR